jgi:hypothetical protein
MLTRCSTLRSYRKQRIVRGLSEAWLTGDATRRPCARRTLSGLLTRHGCRYSLRCDPLSAGRCIGRRNVRLADGTMGGGTSVAANLLAADFPPVRPAPGDSSQIFRRRYTIRSNLKGAARLLLLLLAEQQGRIADPPRHLPSCRRGTLAPRRGRCCGRSERALSRAALGGLDSSESGRSKRPTGPPASTETANKRGDLRDAAEHNLRPVRRPGSSRARGASGGRIVRRYCTTSPGPWPDARHALGGSDVRY